jgi:predicted SprT family Zn-dependent metalloprotease
MARLRRDSAESFGPADLDTALQSLHHQSSRQTRSSPRKKNPASYVVNDDVEDDTEDNCRRVPKVSSRKTQPQQRRQIRLGPLSTVRDSQLSLELSPPTRRARRVRKDEPSLSDEILPPSSSLRSEKKSHRSKQRDLAATGFNAPAEVDLLDDAGRVEVEESICCGSGSDSDSSDEGLPSPSKFFRPLAKTARGGTSNIAETGLEPRLQSLKLTSSVPGSVSLPERNGTQAISRPTTSSDKENDHAMLRFSPPRLHASQRETTPERPITPPQTCPSKGKLMSPSKRAARIPTPPLRPSLDAFWNAETVNEWNDQYSPKKEWKTPQKLKLSGDVSSTTQPSSPIKSPTKRTKAEVQAKKDWNTRKHQIAQEFLVQLDNKVTQGQVAKLSGSTGGIKLIWSKTLNSTAGRANWKRETTKSQQPDGSMKVTHKHFASIELAEKVIDDEDRLLNVIAHEFCHLCNFMISGIKDQPHGRQFKEWGRKCTSAFKDSGIEVTTKHTYEIDYKYVWQCSNEDCGAEFKRHSKSIDLKRHTCGSCRSTLIQIKPVPRKGKDAGSKEPGAPTGYAAYVKLNFAKVKATLAPGASQKEIMEAVAKKYREEKAQQASSSSTPAADGVPSTEVSPAQRRTGRGDGSKDKAGQAKGIARSKEAVNDVARALESINLEDD